MNLTQLTVFKEVMETGSISQAAKQLGRTQPAISLAIRNLEQALGLPLFERRGRRLVPVPEAQYLLAEATSILDRTATVTQTMQSLRAAQSGALNIAVMPGPSAYIFPKFISENVEKHTRFQMTLASRSSPQIRELASSQSIDFGFADFDTPKEAEPRYLSEIVSADCFCAVHRDHALAGQSGIKIEDLAGQDVGMLGGDHPLNRRLSLAFQGAGVGLSSYISSQFFLPLMPFIALGHCVAVVDPLTAVTEQELGISGGQIVFVPFQAPVRYEYAILTPTFRPASQLATRIRTRWKETLLDMLNDMNARPALGAAA